MNKPILKYITPISAIVLFGGLALCVILAHDKRWLSDSISYLGTKPRSTIFFAIWIFTISSLNFIFLFYSVKFIKESVIRDTNSNYRTTAIIGTFVLAFLSLIIAGFTPFTRAYVLHIFCGFFFFSLYPVGMLFLSLWIWEKLEKFTKFSAALVIIYLIVVTSLKLYYKSYVPFEIVALLLICIWNIALNKTLLTLKFK